MKSPHSRTDFFVVLATLLLFVALQQTTSAQAKPGDIPFGQPTEPSREIVWQEFKSEAGGFTVKLPSAPVAREVPFKKGLLTLKLNVNTVRVGSAYYFEVDYVDFPAGYNNPDLSLEGGISGLIHDDLARGATLIKKENVTRGTCEGREAALSLPGRGGGKTGFMQGRIFNSGQRYFFIVFTASEDNKAARDTLQTFMESFVVADGCRAAFAPTVEPSTHTTLGFVEGTLDAATGWRRIESAELGFEVLMPGSAEHETEQGQVEPFPLMHHTYAREDDTAIYTAEVIGDYPPNFHSTANSYDALVDVMTYVIKKKLEPLGIVFNAERNLKLGTFPGRELTISNEKFEMRGRVQIYVTSKRAYIFTAMQRGKSAPAADIERFFSSVHVSTK